eukprot:TRINITY_DN4460_c0_g1_i1.p1 TRINITY_DN4460_c0_g1~~TRINITY_DN4460_c0_g1_i1.p1  ORF type:complete len:240 (-),score=26.84 TRINITY_DN4460_c0_g1_i1:74-793(-)
MDSFINRLDSLFGSPLELATEQKNYNYVDDNIDQELKCTICQEPLLDPILEPKCSQMFCKVCIYSWIQDKRSCPHCRHYTSKETLSPVPRYVINTLNSLKVSCNYCQTAIERNKLEQHDNICSQKLTHCRASDLECPWTGPRSKEEDHEKSCVFILLQPLITKLSTENEQLRLDYSESSSSIKKLEEENKKLRKDLSEVKKRIEALEQKMVSSPNSINSSRPKIKSLFSDDESLWNSAF